MPVTAPDDTTRTALLALTAAADEILATIHAQPVLPPAAAGDLLPRLQTALHAAVEVLHPTPKPPPAKVAVPANILALVGSFVGKSQGVAFHPDDPNAAAIGYACHELGLVPVPNPGITFRSVRPTTVPPHLIPAGDGPRAARPGDRVIDDGKTGRLYTCLVCGGVGLLFVPLEGEAGFIGTPAPAGGEQG